MKFRIEVRVWLALAKLLPDGRCWEWPGHLHRDGYGKIYDGKRLRMAHRVVYEWLVGPVPDGLVLDHLCRTRHCVNPKHLEVVTDRTNILRGTGAAARWAARTHCARGHALVAKHGTKAWERGWRICRECKKINARNLWRANNPGCRPRIP